MIRKRRYRIQATFAAVCLSFAYVAAACSCWCPRHASERNIDSLLATIETELSDYSPSSDMKSIEFPSTDSLRFLESLVRQCPERVIERYQSLGVGGRIGILTALMLSENQALFDLVLLELDNSRLTQHGEGLARHLGITIYCITDGTLRAEALYYRAKPTSERQQEIRLRLHSWYRKNRQLIVPKGPESWRIPVSVFFARDARKLTSPTPPRLHRNPPP